MLMTAMMPTGTWPPPMPSDAGSVQNTPCLAPMPKPATTSSASTPGPTGSSTATSSAMPASTAPMAVWPRRSPLRSEWRALRNRPSTSAACGAALNVPISHSLCASASWRTICGSQYTSA